jgi:xylulokinase
VKNEYPEIYQKTHMFLESKDYLNLRLTGEFAGSYDSTILYWVTDIRNINNIHYDDKLINRLKIDRSKLPPLKSSTDILGTISKEAADEIGLGKEVKVVMGAADHQAALVGSGAVRDFEGHLYIGTSSWIECIVPFKKTDMFHSIASLPAAIPGKYQCINEQDIAGGVLPFLVDNIIYHKNLMRADEPPSEVYKKLDEIAERVPPGSNKLIFTPWLNGERSPVDNTTLRAGLYNVSMTTNMDHIIRAFFEGVAYNTRWNLKYVEKFINRKMDILNFVGGGALSNVWCQIFADVFNRTIRQVENPMQANARGAALIASVALGHITFDDIPELIRYSNTYYPNPENRTMYDELFEEFLKIYSSNKAMYRRLNRIP